LIRIPQDDGPNPPVPIAYSDEFVETMDYFRAVLQSDERSQRSLALTKEVIERNSANYTAWYFRRLVLEALNVDLQTEFPMTDEIALRTPKNYQLWFHRRWLVEKLGDYSRELAFTKSIFDGDSKNYHAWAHRQWIFQYFHLQKDDSLFQQELEFLESMIISDVRNNSAWNYRYYLIRLHSPVLSPEQVKQEIEFAWKYISRSPNNQSSWGYLRGTVKEHFEFSDLVEEKCGEFSEKHKFCSNSLSLLVDLAQRKANEESLKKSDILL